MKIFIKHSEYPVAAFLIGLTLSILVSAGIGAVVITPAINFWLNYFNQDKQVPWMVGAIVGVVPGIGDIAIGLSLLSFVLQFFL